MASKLTKTQEELLEAMKSGVTVEYAPYCGWFNPREYYYRSDNNKKCTTAAKALLKKGLVVVVVDRNRSCTLKYKNQEAKETQS